MNRRRIRKTALIRALLGIKCDDDDQDEYLNWGTKPTLYLEADQEEDQPEYLKDCHLKDPIGEYSEFLTYLQVEVRRLCTQRMIQRTILIGTLMGAKCDDEYLKWGITVTDYSQWIAVTGALPLSPPLAIQKTILMRTLMDERPRPLLFLVGFATHS